MIRDPIVGQQFWGSLTAYSGDHHGRLCPFFGAIADRGGPRKPWLALFTLLMVLSFAGTWFGAAELDTDADLHRSARRSSSTISSFEFSNAFHGAMLSRIAPPSRIGGLSGLSFALGSGLGLHPDAGVSCCCSFCRMRRFHLPDNIPERLSGPITAVWMLVFAIPLFLFTPDRPRSGCPLMARDPRRHRVGDRRRCAASSTTAMSRTTSARARCSTTD